MPRAKRPAPVSWCDEHNRYFFYKYGCTKDAQPVKAYPTPDEVRTYFDWAKTALSGRSK